MRKKSWGDTWRFFEIILDGKNIWIIFATQTISVRVEPGHYSLKMKIDWGGSEEINFSIGSGEEITFECKSAFYILQALLIPYYATFGKNKWILLKQC